MSSDYEIMVALSWKILEAKFRYYMLDKPVLTDYAYDQMEKEYEAVCKQLSVEPTASNMVGFDDTRPSCQHVMLKMGYFGSKKHLKQNKRKKK